MYFESKECQKLQTFRASDLCEGGRGGQSRPPSRLTLLPPQPAFFPEIGVLDVTVSTYDGHRFVSVPSGLVSSR